MFNNTDISGEVTLPDLVMSAITYDVTDKLTVGLGLTYTAWSTYDELRIKFDSLGAVGMKEKASEKDWDDAFRYQLGAEYALTEAWALRAGYIYDEVAKGEFMILPHEQGRVAWAIKRQNPQIIYDEMTVMCEKMRAKLGAS